MNWVDSILSNNEHKQEHGSASRRSTLTELRTKFPWLGVEYADINNAAAALIEGGFAPVKGHSHMFTRNGTTAYIHRTREAVYQSAGVWHRFVTDKATIHCYQHNDFDTALMAALPKKDNIINKPGMSKSSRQQYWSKFKKKQDALEEDFA